MGISNCSLASCLPQGVAVIEHQGAVEHQHILAVELHKTGDILGDDIPGIDDGDGCVIGDQQGDEAAAEGIPVVTLYSDNTKSKRCSYVGIGSYNLGREYGRQVLQIEESRKSRKESADG